MTTTTKQTEQQQIFNDVNEDNDNPIIMEKEECNNHLKK
jgi:hypothetical protein